MRIKQKDFELLASIHSYLSDVEKESLSEPLGNLLDRLSSQRDSDRCACRERAAKNRYDGYMWKSSYHPAKSKYFGGKNDSL